MCECVLVILPVMDTNNNLHFIKIEIADTGINQIGIRDCNFVYIYFSSDVWRTIGELWTNCKR